jgi:hypothetical protein
MIGKMLAKTKLARIRKVFWTLRQASFDAGHENGLMQRESGVNALCLKTGAARDAESNLNW